MDIIFGSPLRNTEVQQLLRIGEDDAKALQAMASRICFGRRGDINAIWKRAFIDAAVSLLTASITPREGGAMYHEGLKKVRDLRAMSPKGTLRHYASRALGNIGIDDYFGSWQIPQSLYYAILDEFEARIDGFCRQAEQEEAAAMPKAA